jgi:hypothetical protein
MSRRKRKHRRGSCGHAQCDRIVALQERLNAPYFWIDQFADWLAGIVADAAEDGAARVALTCQGCRVTAAERYLKEFCQLHDFDAVEGGREAVGLGPVFIARPAGDSFAVQLYSRYPRPSVPTGRLQ